MLFENGGTFLSTHLAFNNIPLCKTRQDRRLFTSVATSLMLNFTSPALFASFVETKL